MGLTEDTMGIGDPTEGLTDDGMKIKMILYGIVIVVLLLLLLLNIM